MLDSGDAERTYAKKKQNPGSPMTPMPNQVYSDKMVCK
jgi:hypothetical protein